MQARFQDHVGVESRGPCGKPCLSFSSSLTDPALEQIADLPAGDRALLASHLSLLEHVARVPDPRKRRGVRHSLSSVLAAATSTGPLKAVTVAAGLAFPHAAQAICLTRRIRPLSGGKWRTVTVYAITSLVAHQATPAQLAAWIRGHWQIEALHHIRDVTYREDNSQVRTGSGLRVMAAIRNLVIAIMRLPGAVSIAATARHYATDATRPLATLGFIPT